MKCCVPYCSSNSKHAAKSKGITYHMFPNQKSHRKTWLQAIGMIDSEVKDHSMICSKHFLPKDIHDTSGGQRRIRNGAVPIKFKESSIDDDDKGANLMVCRICLAIDSKLYPMSICNLGQAFQHITGLTVTAEDGLPQQVCTECATRLSNCYKFREKSLKANTIMLEILKRQEYLSIADIKSVDRENNFLASNLIIKNYEVDYADFNVTYEEKTEARDIDVKSEVDEIYFAENDDVNNDNHDIDHQNDSDDDFKNSDAYNDENDADLDFSSDDSIPLEKQRKKKKRIEKKTVKVRKKQPKKVQSEPKIDRRRKPFLNDDLNETLFTITDLTYDEQVGEIEKRRESANYKNSSFKCQECFKGFLDEHAYSTHMSRHTNECGEHECGICKTHFKHPHALRKHITAHHSQRFSCNQCSYVTTHRQTARLHERWHKGTKYQCPHCQEEFVKFTTYMGHIRIKHPSDFVCELCGFSFVSAKGIELHKKLKHRLEDAQIPDDGPFCELCNVRFVSQEAYRRHLSVSGRHSDKIDPKGKRPKERKEKKREIDDKRLCRNQLRRAEGPIPCEQCGLQLEDSRAYHGHFRRMHPDKNRTNYPSMKTPCMCEVCGRMFQSYALLKDHTWVHTGERPFKCDSCDKSFRMKQRLVAHRRVHSQVKRTYVCNVCGKHFSTHSNRQRHMFIHTGLKPFKCEMCGKGFKHSSEKRAHITYVHLKKPWPKRTRGKRRLDGRPGQIQPPSLPTSGSEMDVQPIWPPCDPKLNEINSIIDDKPMYYNLKQVI